MVKRFWKYAIGLSLVLTLLLTVGIACWLFATNSGARWLVDRLVRQAPIVLTVQQVKGRLCDRLLLTGIAASAPEGELAVEELELAWRPANLLRGKLLLTELRVDGLHLDGSFTSAESEPSRPAEPLRWPELPGWLRWIEAEIEQLQLLGLSWQRPDQPALLIERVAARVKWTGNRLEVDNFTVLAAEGELAANLEARWGQPLLRLKGDARLKNVASEPAELSLNLELQPGPDGDGFAGTIRLSANSAPSGELDLTSQLVLSGQQLSLEGLELRQVGDRGRIAGDLRLGWAAEPVEVQADLVLEHLNLSRFTGQATDLGGTVQLGGSLDDYRGRFELNNRVEGWQALRLAGDFSGNDAQANLTGLDAHLLGGQIQGELSVAWQPELLLEGRLAGRNLNPGVYRSELSGTVNLDLAGFWRQPEDQPMELQLQGRLHDSLLRGYPLIGQVDARLRDSELELAALELKSKGTTLNAHGVLSQRIDFQASVAELSAWLSEAEGALQGDGWLRWQNEELSGAAQGSGRNIRYGDLTLQSVDFAAEQRSAKGQGQLKLQVGQLQAADLPAIDGKLQVLGTLESHEADASLQMGADNSIELSLAGGYQQEKWQGSLQRLVLQDKTGPFRLLQPTVVTVSPRELNFDELELQGTADEGLSAAADLELQPFSGQVRGKWRQIDLARANPWLPSYQLSGQSSGHVDLKLPEGGAPDLAARVELNGKLVQEHLTVGLQRGLAELAWNRSGLEGQIQLHMDEGGRLEGHCRSPEPAAKRLPQHVQWQLDWQDLNLGRVQPFLPSGMTAAGQLDGKASGDWGSEGVFSATGSAAVEGGRLVGTVGEGRLSLLLKSGTFDWDWHDRQLQGGVALVLEEYGRLDGKFQLPLPARLPLAFEAQGAINATLTGKLREMGLVTVIFPGVLQETRGQLEMDLTATGQWSQPVLGGSLGLKEAGAYVPSAGIELQDITLQAELAGDQVKLSSFSVRSGKGLMQGKGSLQLQDWQPASYTATLEGEGFELVHLPELELSVNPRLSLKGTLQGVEVNGALTVPEMLVRGAATTGAEGPSEDVIIVSQELPEEPAEPFALKADVELLLGDQVLFKAKGLDARLTGSLKLMASAIDQVRAKGKISVAEGKFSAYGAKLDIQRGLLMFNGPVENPRLDILAIRVLRSVKAGVRVTGTAKDPIITLYSEPAMSDSDRLAYIVLGRPLARNSGEAALMMTAAGALLSEGESAVLQDRLERTLGLEVGFEAGDDNGNGAGSLLTIGKYLSPDLYISYGKSLFSETSEFRMRYSLGEHWDIESMTGTESGVDLFYRIEWP